MADIKIVNPKIKGKLKLPDELASKALQISATGELEAATVSTVELGHLVGVTSPVQTQIGNKADASAVSTHISDVANPHAVTKTQVGLGNADNTSDANKPVSTAQQTALNLKADLASPTFTGTVSGISKSMVGLGNVDNTSDANKPVSTAQQTALNLKADLASPTFTGTVSGITKSMVGLSNVDNTSDASKNSASVSLTNKTIDAASNTISNIAVANLASGVIDTDISTTSGSDDTIPSAKAAKSYTESQSALRVSKSGDSMSGNLAMGNNKVTGLAAGSASGDAVNYAQLSALSAGAVWSNPISDPDLVDANRAAQPGSPVNGDVYIASATAGDWTTGHAYFSTDSGATWIDLLGRAVVVGDRFGISMESATAAVGVLSSKDDNLAQVTNATPGSVAFSFEVPATSHAVYVSSDISSHAGHQYNYNGSSWVEFGGASAINAGIGLAFSGNVLNINLGAGIAQLPSDEVGIDVKADGGLDVVDPTSGVHSTATDAQLAIKIDGSTLSKSTSGIKVAALGITNSEVSASAAIAQSKIANLVSDLSGKEATITATSAADYYRGDKTFQTLNKAAVGLANVDNTSDANKPVSTATQTALNLKADLASPTFTGTVSGISKSMVGLGSVDNVQQLPMSYLDIDNTLAANSDVKVASQKAIKSYVTTAIGASSHTGDIAHTSFAAANNVVAAASVTGLAFAAGSVRSFKIQISVSIDATTDLNEIFDLQGIQLAGGFVMASSSVGDDSGVVFTVTSAGQIQYVSQNSAGFVSSKFSFRAQVTDI